MATEGFAPAKINLSLHVTGQRADGYHLLDSLVVFADVGDRLWFEPADAMSLEVGGPFSDAVPTDARNLVWKAAETAGWTGRIRLEKNLPNGAGVGGGSADAAAVLRQFLGDKAQDVVGMDRVLSLGADVPVCMFSGPQRMAGIGDAVSQVWPIPECDLVMVNPGISVPTAGVFASLIDKVNDPMSDIYTGTSVNDFVIWLKRQRNDLQPISSGLFPDIAKALAALDDAMLCRMSGSGSTCFGIYPSARIARLTADRVRADHPDWWVKCARTIGAPPA